ncbi:hypothetical protein [Streptomyces sp. H39-C1]|uniref:hypothetical protein n=1 Tax=Streptomyces sp. H39-C1 TaxID=3004355 RepID=UPI0022AEB8C5|nr:hypothetical protein [Streptomyces sp. H39-C1]MCZ4099679.1 hypothetical protein [Streptomyces sp. H39-C1]
MLGGLLITGAATVAVGPALGGLLVAWAGWRSAFWINIPVAAVILILVLTGIPRDADPVRPGSPRALASRVDWLGMLGFGGSLAALMIFLSALPRLGRPRSPPPSSSRRHISGVVLTTLRQAADEDYRLFVLADATADPGTGSSAGRNERLWRGPIGHAGAA